MSIGKRLRRWFWDDPALGYSDPGNDPMSCPQLSIPAIDPAFYKKLYAQAVAGGVKFDGESAAFEGIVLSWSYDPSMQMLTVACQKKPFFISCGEIEQRIADLIHKAKTEGI